MIISAKNKRKCKLLHVTKLKQIGLVTIGRNGLKYAFTQTKRGRGE
jgi:hypothetical protein